jgi:hypothetical protein
MGRYRRRAGMVEIYQISRIGTDAPPPCRLLLKREISQLESQAVYETKIRGAYQAENI